MSRIFSPRSTRALHVMVAALAASALVACSDYPSSVPYGDGGEIAVSGSFTLSNRGVYSDVRIDPCGQTGGGNRLFEGLFLGNGTETWTMSAGCYDIRTTTVDGSVHAMYHVYLAAGETVDIGNTALLDDPNGGS
jgi:hypothetical protein